MICIPIPLPEVDEYEDCQKEAEKRYGVANLSVDSHEDLFGEGDDDCYDSDLWGDRHRV